MDLGAILGFIIIGAIAGVIARFIVPGPDPMGWIATIVLGIIGSFVGGSLANIIFGGVAAISSAGIIGSIIGAIIVLLIWRQVGSRRAAT
ncbi:MAG: GlsB/YeaQ/YmgE family stress response membrane protein [Chloroflexota bacterium]